MAGAMDGEDQRAGVPSAAERYVDTLLTALDLGVENGEWKATEPPTEFLDRIEELLLRWFRGSPSDDSRDEPTLEESEPTPEPSPEPAEDTSELPYSERICNFDGCTKHHRHGLRFCNEHAGGRTRDERIEIANKLGAEGRTQAEIADELGVSPSTVGVYIFLPGEREKAQRLAERAKAGADERRLNGGASNGATKPGPAPQPPEPGSQRDQILNCLRDSFDMLTPGQISEQTNLPSGSTAAMLSKMVARGEAVRENGRYGVAPPSVDDMEVRADVLEIS